MKRLLLSAVIASAICSSGFAQMTPPPLCKPGGNPDWRALDSYEIGAILDTRFEHSYFIPYLQTTSILPAEGEPPQPPQDGDADEEAQFMYERALSEWSCMYGPAQVVDGDPITAWSEGVAGSGEGEIIVVHLGDARDVDIWTGFGMSERLHKRNGRPREVRVSVLQALSGMANQFDLTVGHLVILSRGTATLEDVNAYQPLALPAFEVITNRDRLDTLLAPFFDGAVPQWAVNPMEPEESLYLAVEILSVYPGSVYEDTLISEIRVHQK